ncbi:MAG: DUF1844 domain-containing protein [Thermoplasmatota archaeon]
MEDNEDQSSEQDAKEAQRELARLLSNVKDMTVYNLSVLASQAWHHLGLVPIPGVEEPKMDLEQAKLAIDLFDANLKVLSPSLDKDIDKQLKQTLADLQLNYVNKSK